MNELILHMAAMVDENKKGQSSREPISALSLVVSVLSSSGFGGPMVKDLASTHFWHAFQCTSIEVGSKLIYLCQFLRRLSFSNFSFLGYFSLEWFYNVIISYLHQHLVFYGQVRWGGKGSTEEGAKLEKPKNAVIKMPDQEFEMLDSRHYKSRSFKPPQQRKWYTPVKVFISIECIRVNRDIMLTINVCPLIRKDVINSYVSENLIK